MYEQRCFDSYKPEYNIAKIAGAPMAGRVHTEASRVSMSRAQRGKKKPAGFAEKISCAQQGNKNFLGRKHTPQTIAKMVAAKTGLRHTSETKEKLRLCNLSKGPQLSAEQREKIRLKLIGKKRTVEQRARIAAGRRAGKKTPPFSKQHCENLALAGRRMWAARRTAQ